MQLYIHFPFCKSKCQYCDFNSYACQTDETIFSYVAALNRELSFCAEKFSKAKIKTVYIGGGTPSMLNENFITLIAKNIKSKFDVSDLEEFSIECNPESIEDEKLKAYKSVGINRLSIGVQSLDDKNLRSMGRLHNAKQALEKLQLANKYFDNVSCDLIVGLPYDTKESVESEIRTLAPLVKHISMYELSVENGTPLKKRVDEGRILLPDDDEVADLFDVAIDTAHDCGLERYEVSNFAREGYYSRHNYGYWTREEYIGLGAGAHSLVKTKDGQEKMPNAIRFASPKDINAYIGGVNCVSSFDDVPRVDMNVLDEKDEKNESIMLGLRTTKGIDKKLLDLQNIQIDARKYLVEDGDSVHLTRQGISVMNSILVKILDI